LEAAEVEEQQLSVVPLGGGDTSHNHSESSIQQPTSGTSTLNTSTLQSPSEEVKEFTNTELSAALSAAMGVDEFGMSRSEDKKEDNTDRG
jgi:hypothetical protein